MKTNHPEFNSAFFSDEQNEHLNKYQWCFNPITHALADHALAIIKANGMEDHFMICAGDYQQLEDDDTFADLEYLNDESVDSSDTPIFAINRDGSVVMVLHDKCSISNTTNVALLCAVLLQNHGCVEVAHHSIHVFGRSMLNRELEDCQPFLTAVEKALLAYYRG